MEIVPREFIQAIHERRPQCFGQEGGARSSAYREGGEEAKKTEDPAVGEELLGLIKEIDEVFQATKS